MNRQVIGNITTLIKTGTMMFAGYCLGYFVSIGLNLPISQEQLSEILFVVICFAAAYFDAKYPNAFKFLHSNNAEVIAESEADLINEEYYEENFEI